MTTAEEFNPYEELARTRKAARLALTFATAGIPHGMVSEMDFDSIRDVAEAAGINRPSEATIIVMLEMLESVADTPRMPTVAMALS